MGPDNTRAELLFHVAFFVVPDNTKAELWLIVASLMGPDNIST